MNCQLAQFSTPNYFISIMFFFWSLCVHGVRVCDVNKSARLRGFVLFFFSGDTALPKFSISGDQRSLTVSNLCKICEDSTHSPSDLQVIQCNASNTHGYALGTGYINVLRE